VYNIISCCGGNSYFIWFIKDEKILTERVVSVREKALKTFDYVCLRRYAFTEPRIHSHPVYSSLQKDHDPERRLLDLGCCMGTDLRAFLVDGVVTPENARGLELEKSFVDIGYELFQDAERLPSNTFVIADSLKEEGLPFPPNHFDLIYCSAVYHLLNKEQGVQMTKNVFKALKSKSENGKEGIFFGKTTGSSQAHPYELPDERNGVVRWMHTAETLKQLLEEVGFQKVEVINSASDISGGTGRPRANKEEYARSFLSFTAYKQ